MMLIDHERSREIGNSMENSAKEYLSSGNSEKLISDMQLYVDHITEHLWKENNKLFMMAEARLQYVSEKVESSLSPDKVAFITANGTEVKQDDDILTLPNSDQERQVCACPKWPR